MDIAPQGSRLNTSLPTASGASHVACPKPNGSRQISHMTASVSLWFPPTLRRAFESAHGEHMPAPAALTLATHAGLEKWGLVSSRTEPDCTQRDQRVASNHDGTASDLPPACHIFRRGLGHWAVASRRAVPGRAQQTRS